LDTNPGWPYSTGHDPPRRLPDTSVIFVLGDSRTATTSLHHWFLDQGIASLHYFVGEAALAEPLHRHRQANWPRLHQFIQHSGAEAFSDYPVRVFFRELAAAFPAAHFILTTRRDTATWRDSMTRYFADRPPDLDLLEAFYVAWNEEIRALFAESGGRFLDLCIDAAPDLLGRRIAGFLDLPYAPLPRLNTAAS
jgi:hypothetical protein